MTHIKFLYGFDELGSRFRMGLMNLQSTLVGFKRR